MAQVSVFSDEPPKHHPQQQRNVFPVGHFLAQKKKRGSPQSSTLEFTAISLTPPITPLARRNVHRSSCRWRGSSEPNSSMFLSFPLIVFLFFLSFPLLHLGVRGDPDIVLQSKQATRNRTLVVMCLRQDATCKFTPPPHHDHHTTTS